MPVPLPETDDELRARLNAETGKIRWKELERHFARGSLITVADDLDLVEVGMCMVKDDKARIEAWMKAGKVGRATAEDAKDWVQCDPLFWAVVSAPWILVQETEDIPENATH